MEKWTFGKKRLLRSRAQGRPSDRPVPDDAPDYLLKDITNISVYSEDIQESN